MIKTPIDDFVRAYAEGDTLRMHMPGHQGVGEIEKYDITEIKGADSLYSADGIIKDSETIASYIFGSYTYYSTEGSSLAIRAMLYLALVGAKARGRSTRILAGRNAHKVFLSAAALLDLDCEWISTPDDYISCNITPEILLNKLAAMDEMPMALYVTSPDYLGNMLDIKALADICHERGILLLVDNAHGAYLRFLAHSKHPIDLGADMCADSAHKTLPALTGGAYLHISPSLDKSYRDGAKRALELFGSTSPSYLILASLDRTNRFLVDNKRIVPAIASVIRSAKYRLVDIGYSLVGSEELKISISTRKYGYDGNEFAEILRSVGIECEFSDSDYIVFMPHLMNPHAVRTLEASLSAIPKRDPIPQASPAALAPLALLSIREATMSPTETLPIEDCVGRIVAAADVSCPPAVPILMPGELVEPGHIEILRAYGKTHLTVVK